MIIVSLHEFRVLSPTLLKIVKDCPKLVKTNDWVVPSCEAAVQRLQQRDSRQPVVWSRRHTAYVVSRQPPQLSGRWHASL